MPPTSSLIGYMLVFLLERRIVSMTVAYRLGVWLSVSIASVCYITLKMKETSLISLENFNASRTKPPYLSSPRSLEACRRLGVDPRELLLRNKHDFVTEDCKGLDMDAIDLKYNHFMERRQELFDSVVAERLKLMEEESQGLWAPSKSKGHYDSKASVDSNLSSALIEREKRELERIQRRQQQEIQQIIDHEVKIETIRERNEEKTIKQQEKEERRQASLREKHQQQEMRKRQEEERKRIQAEEEALLQKQRAHEEFDRQQKKKEEDALKEKIRRKEAKERERLAAMKREDFQKNTEELLAQQKLRAEERKQELDQKEAKRLAKLEEQQTLRKEQSQQQRAMKAVKLQTAKENLASLLEEQRISFARRQQKNEEKRLQFEEDRKRAVEETKIRSDRKAEEIRRVIQSNQAREEERLLRYNQSRIKLEERQAQLAELKEKELKDKAARAQQKQLKLEMVLEANVANVHQRIEKVLTKQQEKDQAVMKLKSAQKKALIMKKTAEEIKRQDRFDAVKRLGRQQEYQREKVMGRIQEQYDRIQHINTEKQAILEQRKKLRGEVEAEKKQIIEKFERLKKQKGGISNSEELSTLLKTVKTQSSETHQSSSKLLVQPKAQLKSPEPIPQSAEVKSITPQVQKHRLPKPQAPEGGVKPVRSLLDEAKKKQYQEMAVLLAQEQAQEQRRDEQLSTETDPVQRDHLEKQFGLERALASQRIMRLSE